MATEEYLSRLQAIRGSAALLIRDDHNRVLVLRTTYKPDWEIPGGAMEPGETPSEAARREAREELGLELTTGRLLCADYGSPRPDLPSPMIHFVFEGPVLASGEAAFALTDGEIAEALLLPLEEVLNRVGPHLGVRLVAAIEAVAHRTTIYLENGRRQSSPTA